MNKSKLEKEVDALGQEISKAHILIFALSEIIKQSNLNFNIYKKYWGFFSLSYNLFWNELIHNISRLQDTSRDSLSVVKVLKRHVYDIDDEKSNQEKEILEKIEKSDTNKKIKRLRDKLGKAHLDGKISINPGKRHDIWKKNKETLGNIVVYLELITQGVEIISCRLDETILLLKPYDLIKKHIKNLFNSLNDKEKS